MSGTSAREEILARIGQALKTPDVGPAGGARPPRAYRVVGDGDDPSARLERFAARVGDYRARVHLVEGEAGVAAAVAACLDGGGVYAVPPRLSKAWLRRVDSGRIAVDDGTAGPHALDALAGSVSGCALAIAETGTIVLDGGEGQGRRALTLVPDHLVVVVGAAQIVATVPEAMRALGPAVRAGPHALTLVSGPSATSDIELSRVEGVHGPRRLDVVVARGLDRGGVSAGAP